jgi:hypothetical protein
MSFSELLTLDGRYPGAAPVFQTKLFSEVQRRKASRGQPSPWFGSSAIRREKYLRLKFQWE